MISSFVRTVALVGSLALPVTGHSAPADDVDFLFRLGMLEGHLMVGHDLIKAGRNKLALPHFGHPVCELYDDISGYLATKRVTPFDKQLIQLEAAVASAPGAPATEALYTATIKSVQAARLSAPAELRASVPGMIRICADTIDAAAGEFGEALNRGRIETLVEYHDSRGYLSYVQQEVNALAAASPDPASQGMIARFKIALAKALWIVDPLIPDPTPRASVGQYRAVAAEAAAVVARP